MMTPDAIRASGTEKALADLAIYQGFPEWRGQDLNLRPSGYEPDELPDCSTPRRSEVRTLGLDRRRDNRAEE